MRFLFMLAIVLTSDALAEIRPSFNADPSAWHATDVVVVTEGDAIDGNVEVLESWKGSLSPGDRIIVPALAAFASEKRRAVERAWYQTDDVVPAWVTCSRMVLFLTDRAAHDVTVSTAWIEDDEVFAFRQAVNPGPSELISLGKSEAELKRAVGDVVTAQKRFTEAMRTNDASHIATAVLPLLHSESFFVPMFIIQTLGESGPNGWPALRKILGDESLLPLHDDAIIAATRSAGTEAAAEIMEILRQELSFWKNAGPALDPGWRQGDGVVAQDELNRLNAHGARMFAALWAVKRLGHTDACEVVLALKDLWRSLPQLGSGGDIGSLDLCAELH